MTEEEKLAYEWLRSRGYEPEFEPAIVAKGRSPDFLAKSSSNPNSLWAEVKTLEPEDVTIVMGRAANIIQATPLPDDLHGFATLYVNDVTRDQSVKAVLKLFAENAPKYKDERVWLIFTQQVPDAKGLRRIDINNPSPARRFWIRGAGEQKLAAPPDGLDDGFAIATIKEGGVDRNIEAFMIFDWNLPIECTLIAKLDPDDHQLSVSPMGGGFVSVSPRVQSAVESANSQIRNGCRYLTAPGVVLVVPPPYGPVDDLQIAAAAYGKLMISIPVGAQVGGARPIEHGPDAAFQSKKNRHVSAIIRLYRDGSPGMYFPNRFAHHPVDKDSPLLRGLKCYPPAIS